MDTFIKITTIKTKWYLCNDIRKYIWDVSNRNRCYNCGKDLGNNINVSIYFIRNRNLNTYSEELCFYCCHKKKWPQ